MKTLPKLIITAALGFSLGYAVRGAQSPQNQIMVQETYSVSRIIDGDTIELEDGILVQLDRIRLLGIDTPERGKPLYREAGKKLEELIAGRAVLLERDNDDVDRYGRALRYILVDNKNLNVEMVRLGYARAFMHKVLRYENEILSAEEEARVNRRGVWEYVKGKRIS